MRATTIGALIAACLLLAGLSCTTPFVERGEVSPGTRLGVSVYGGGAIMPSGLGPDLDLSPVAAAGASAMVEHGLSKRFAARLAFGGLLVPGGLGGQPLLIPEATAGVKLGLDQRSSLAASCTMGWAVWEYGGGMFLPDLTFAWDDEAGNTVFICAGLSGLGGGTVIRRTLAPRLGGYIRLQANLLLPSVSIGLGLEGPTGR